MEPNPDADGQALVDIVLSLSAARLQVTISHGPCPDEELQLAHAWHIPHWDSYFWYQHATPK